MFRDYTEEAEHALQMKIREMAEIAAFYETDNVLTGTGGMQPASDAEGSREPELRKVYQLIALTGQYRKRIRDQNQMAAEEIRRVFAQVRETDRRMSRRADSICSTMDHWIRYLQQINQRMNPAGACYQASVPAGRLREIAAGLLQMSQIAVRMQQTEEPEGTDRGDVWFFGNKEQQQYRETWELDWEAAREFVYQQEREGCYGGSQMSVLYLGREERTAYYRFIRDKYPDRVPELTDLQIDRLFTRLSSEGCGYVALVNTVFCYFAGRPDQFEQTFGYPMTGTDGMPVYEQMLVDLYAGMDNRNEEGFPVRLADYSKEEDGLPGSYDYWDDPTGAGTTQLQRKYYLETFLREFGVDVTVETNADITVQNCEDYLQSGWQVIVAFHNGTLYFPDGTPAQNISTGHAMCVTGVTEDGNYLVSSWGKPYLIRPEEALCTAPGDRPYTGNTSLTFSIVRFGEPELESRAAS